MKVSRSSAIGAGWVMRIAGGLRDLRTNVRGRLGGAFAAILLLVAAPAAQAQIQNGGFETGSFSNWTLRDYNRGDSTIPVTSSAQLGLTASGTVSVGGNGTGFRSSILGSPGTAPNTNGNLKYPFSGSASALIGGSGSLKGTSIEQVATMALSDVDPVDGKVHIRFAMAPLLNNPSHPAHQQPFFYVEVINQTKGGTTLFNTFNYSNQPGIPWQSVGNYQYTNWQGFDISPGNGLLDVGDQVLLKIYVSNCAQGAADHTGQVYVDVFGSRMPGLSVNATGPAIAKPGEQVTYSYNYINNSGVFAIDSWVRLAAPITENGLHLAFVPGAWPPGCTAIQAGTSPRANYIDCPVGNLNDGDGGTFQVSFTVPAGAATASPSNIVNNGDYDIRASTVSPFIGPLVKTTILPSATPTVDLGITVSNGGVPSYAVGGAVGYAVTVTNNGPIDVVGAVITQTLSGASGTAAWTCAPAPGSTAACGTASGTGPVTTTGNLPANQSLVYTVTGITATAAGTPVVTVVKVAPPAGTSDSVSSNNTDGLSTPVSAEQHTLTVNTTGAGTGRVNAVPVTLACASPGGSACNSQLLGKDQEAYLTAVADPGSVFKNWTGDCTTTTGNQCYVKMGSTDLAVTAVFAKVWTVTPTTVGGTISPNAPQIVEDGQGTSFTITPGTPGQVPVITTPGGANACPGTLTGPVAGSYTWSVSPVTEDCAFHVTFLTPAPKLSLAKTGPSDAVVGVPFNYVLTVTNIGTAAMTANATVTDAMPAGIAFDNMGGCAATGLNVSCTVAPLAAGASQSFTITLHATGSAVSPLSNTAYVTGGGDPACAPATPCASPTVTTNLTFPTITAVDDNPPAVSFGSAVMTTVGGNDTATDGTVGAIIGNTDGANGTVACTGTGSGASCTYTPNAGFSGVDTYTYDICLATPVTTICDTATVTVVIGPDAANDAVGTLRNTPVSATAAGGDTFPPGATFSHVGTATNGTVTVDPDGSYTFTPAAGFTGTATFAYQVCLPAPNGAVCDTATVTVTVGAVSIDAVDDSAPAVPFGTPTVATTVGGNDTATNGTLGAITGNTSGTYGAAVCAGTGAAAGCTYTPNAGFSGVDSYTYTICLAAPNADICDTATVAVVVGPQAMDDTASTPRNTDVSRSVVGNDTFQSGSTFAQVGPVANGSVVMAANGAYTFTPDTNFTGTATFDYEVCLPAPNGTVCDAATVTVSVGMVSIDAVDDATPAVSFGSPAVTAVGGNDTAVDGTVGAITGNTDGANGTVACTGTGVGASCTYTPNAGFSGVDSYTYTICLAAPNADICSTATVTVVVGPDAQDDTAATVENTSMSGSVTGGDTYPPGSTFGPGGTPPTGGTVVIQPDGSYVFTPTTGFIGTATFEYQVCLPAPNAAVCDAAIVEVAVTASADLSVVKRLVTGGPYVTGQTVTFEIVVANAGPSAATNVTVVDNASNLTLAGVTGACSALPCTLATLAAGASATIRVDATIDGDGAFANNATAGTPDQPDPNPGNNASTDGNIAATPSLSLAKQAGVPVDVNGNGLADAGDTIDYRFTVTNTGGTPLDGIAVSDPKVSATAIACTPGSIPAGGTAMCGPVTYTVTADDVAAGGVHNSATASGTLPGGIPVTSDPSTTHTPLTASAPGLASAKTMTGYADEDGSGGLTVGDVMSYEIAVTNTGNVPVKDVVIGDARLSPASITCSTVSAGDACVLAGTSVVTQADFDAGKVVNTATVVVGSVPGMAGLPPELCPAGSAAPACAPTTSTEITRHPSIATAKTAALTVDKGTQGVANVGDVITYAVTVTNDGDVTLHGVTVEDTMDGRAPVMLACAPTTLAPGQSATCASYSHTVTAEDAGRRGGSLDNKVVATGASVSGSSMSFSVTALGNAAVLVEPDPVQIRLVKSAAPYDVKVGDLVRYTLAIQNTGTSPLVGGTIVDTPPAGFSYVDGSLVVDDADKAGRLTGIHPIAIADIDLPAGRTATVTYLLRVGAGVRAGIHTNSALMRDGGETVSNVATASVQLSADPILDESLIVGTVFDDHDGDGWQDSAALAGVKVQGGFAPGAYVAGSTMVDRGKGPQPEADASAPLLHGIALGTIGGRESEADLAAKHRMVVSQTLAALDFTDDFVLTSDEGVTVRMDAAGNTTTERAGRAAKGLTAAAPTVSRTVSQVADGYRVDYVIENTGIDERGIPGVRIASVEGLLAETDQFGRYHLTGIDGGRWERGRNFILKVDPATLPPGAVFSTDNPLLRRVTPGLPVRFDFGVKLPAGLIEGGTQPVELELGEVLFDPGSANLRSDYLPVVEKMAAQIREHGAGEVAIAANGGNEALAFERAKAVRDALVATLDPVLAQATMVSLRADLADPGSTLLSLGESPVLGTVLFDTDKSAIKPEFAPVIEKIAAGIEKLGGGVVGVIGHADRRGSDAYNAALGLRRAKAVYEAIAAKLGAEARKRLRVEINDNPTAPVGLKRG